MAQAYRVLRGGPLDDHMVRASKVRGAWVWMDAGNACHPDPGPGRYLYRVDGAELRFAGLGARRCDGCGAVLDQSPDGGRVRTCPLCGAGDGSGVRA